ncbi:MAG: PilZ domain-containing protein [Clostridiales bacterium]|nr:PilZ domain-containing protein [Clostridiales bacterium]
MYINDIPQGANIDLEVKLKNHSMSFRSRVVIIIHDSLLVEPITFNEQTIGFDDDCLLRLIVNINNKIFMWDDITIKLVKYDNGIYHKIDLSGQGKPYNRRDAYRIYIGEDMPVYINTASGPIALSVLVKDLSETGVAFITKEELETDRTIRLKLKDNNHIISLSGKILRKEFLPNLNSFLYGCKFIEKNQKLGNFIAKKQGEQLRKRVNSYSSPPMAITSPKNKKKRKK